MNGIMHGMQIEVSKIFGGFRLDSQMTEDLGHDLAAGACRHRLFDEVAGLVDERP